MRIRRSVTDVTMLVFTPHSLREALTLYHVKRGFDVGSLVIVLQKLRTVQTIKVIHPRPEL